MNEQKATRDAQSSDALRGLDAAYRGSAMRARGRRVTVPTIRVNDEEFKERWEKINRRLEQIGKTIAENNRENEKLEQEEKCLKDEYTEMLTYAMMLGLTR